MQRGRSRQRPEFSGSVLFPFVGDSVGGSHISALSLIDSLPACGIHPVVGLHRTDGPLAEFLRQRQTPFEALPDHVVGGRSLAAEFAGMMRVAPSLAALQRSGGYSLVHTNDSRMHVTWALAARLARSAHVWHQRTINPSRRLALYSLLPSRVLTISEYCRRGLPPSMAARAHVIDEPFDLPDQSAADKLAHRARLIAEVGVPSDSVIVGYVANMEEQKRPALFLEIVALHLLRTNARCHYVMIGDPRGFVTPERQLRLQQEPLAGRLHLLGPRFPILPYIAGIDVLVAPGVNEGLGRTVVEAMLLSTAVLATDDGGHRDIVVSGRTGILARRDDAHDFVSALAALVDDEKYRTALAEAARPVARGRFDSRRHAEAVAEIYAQLAPDLRH